MNKKKAQRTFIFGCLAPAVILAILFIAVPTITVFKESFFDKTDLIHDGAFVALDNFKVLFSDERFIESMQNINFNHYACNTCYFSTGCLIRNPADKRRIQRKELLPCHLLYS